MMMLDIVYLLYLAKAPGMPRKSKAVIYKPKTPLRTLRLCESLIPVQESQSSPLMRPTAQLTNDLALALAAAIPSAVPASG